MMKDLRIDFKPQRVANLLKQAINQNCVKGEEWYEDIGEMPSVFDMYFAIKILEGEESKQLTIVDDTEDTEGRDNEIN